MLWNKGASWASITSYLYFDHDIMAMIFKRIWAYNIRSIHCAEASHVYDELKLVLESDKCCSIFQHDRIGVVFDLSRSSNSMSRMGA